MTNEIKIGDRIKNTISGQVQTANKIKHGYINGYRADLWVLVASEVNQDIEKDLKQIDKMLSGRMSDTEHENFDMKLFGTI